VAPGGHVSPAFLLTDLAVGVFDYAFAFDLFSAPGIIGIGDLFPNDVVDANAKGAFFGVTKGDWHGIGREVDVEYDQARVGEIVEMDGPGFIQDGLAFGGAPFVARRKLAVVLFELRLANVCPNNPTPPFALRPEVDAVNVLWCVRYFEAFGDDIAVAEPKRLLMNVSGADGGLLLDHGTGPRHRRVAESVEGPEVRFRNFASFVITSPEILTGVKIDPV